MYKKNDHVQNYIGFPWASLLDNKINMKIPFRKIFNGNNNITCCQHISFRKTLPFLKRIGVTKLYTPHKIRGEDKIYGIEIIACPHYAVNFEDKERNSVFNDVDFEKIDSEKSFIEIVDENDEILNVNIENANLANSNKNYSYSIKLISNILI